MCIFWITVRNSVRHAHETVCKPFHRGEFNFCNLQKENFSVHRKRQCVQTIGNCLDPCPLQELYMSTELVLVRFKYMFFCPSAASRDLSRGTIR
jgi:hypothetical protein